MTQPRVAAYGLSIAVARGWDARIFRHPHGEPTLHIASFALPRHDGEFGVHATEAMRAGGVFIAVTEYRPDPHLAPGRGLFAGGPPTRLESDDFDARALLVARPHQLGHQRFFTAAGRPFCLYAVVRPRGNPAELARVVSDRIRTIAVEPRPHG